MPKPAKKNRRIFGKEVEKKILEFFDMNYERLRQEGGHALAADAKERAFEQVVMYWKRLQNIATSVSQTEVNLSLPEQMSPEGRKFTIEGVVDIVQEDEKTMMYDIKTHAANDVKANREFYEGQLNVYAHIWKSLHQNNLDGTAIIATKLPPRLRYALSRGVQELIDQEIENWDPIVDLPFDTQNVEETIAEFGRCVDQIENNEFSPPKVSVLKAPVRQKYDKTRDTMTDLTFAELYCADCDVRFSCSSHLKLKNKDVAADSEFESGWIESNE